MSLGDRITILVAAGAISATLGIGSCSTNVRISDVNTQLNTRIDDVNARIDDLQADIRELRMLIIDPSSATSLPTDLVPTPAGVLPDRLSWLPFRPCPASEEDGGPASRLRQPCRPDRKQWACDNRARGPVGRTGVRREAPVYHICRSRPRSASSPPWSSCQRVRSLRTSLATMSSFVFARADVPQAGRQLERPDERRDRIRRVCRDGLGTAVLRWP